MCFLLVLRVFFKENSNDYAELKCGTVLQISIEERTQCALKHVQLTLFLLPGIRLHHHLTKKIHIGPDPAPTEISCEIPINFSGTGSDQVFI